jgi:3-keto-L-gulonate-6-phosphate decarboxylase
VSSPLAAAHTLRSWTRLPVAVSGGFSATDHTIINGSDWDILIVGRSISEAVRPREAAQQLITLIHQRGARRAGARDTY